LLNNLSNFITYHDSGILYHKYRLKEIDLPLFVKYIRKENKPFFSKGYEIILTFLTKNMANFAEHG